MSAVHEAPVQNLLELPPHSNVCGAEAALPQSLLGSQTVSRVVHRFITTHCRVRGYLIIYY